MERLIGKLINYGKYGECEISKIEGDRAILATSNISLDKDKIQQNQLNTSLIKVKKHL